MKSNNENSQSTCFLVDYQIMAEPMPTNILKLHHHNDNEELQEEIIQIHDESEIEPDIITKNTKNTKKVANGLEIHSEKDAEDPLGDSYNSVTNHDYEPPCPVISTKCPVCIIVCCCCCWSRYDRQQCALALLYTKFYLLLYALTILITIALLIYDLSNGSIANSNLDKEPYWFIGLDIGCVALMVFDIIIQIQSNSGTYFKSILNWIDFIIVIACVVSIPVYWFAPDWILSAILLTRFIVRIFRVFTIARHQKSRKAYIDATNTIVDFTKFDAANDINQLNQGTQELM